MLCAQLINDVDLWGMDLFHLFRVTDQHPLVAVFMTIFEVRLILLLPRLMPRSRTFNFNFTSPCTSFPFPIPSTANPDAPVGFGTP